MFVLTMVLLQAGSDPQAMLANASSALSAEPRCRSDPDSAEVVVCGRRRADRYRLPFVVHDAGDPRHEAVAAERERLLARTNPVQDLSPFLVESGMVAVGIGSSGGEPVRLRGIAP